MAELGKNENAINDEELDAVSGGKYIVFKAEGLMKEHDRVSLTSKEGLRSTEESTKKYIQPKI